MATAAAVPPLAMPALAGEADGIVDEVLALSERLQLLVGLACKIPMLHLNSNGAP